MPLTAGTHLGSFEILGLLGAGGMGEVYRAKDLRLGREVAIKVLPADVADNPDRLARFEREARSVAALNHPNIVTLYSVEDADGVRFLAMELIEGQTLAALVTPGGLPLARLLDLAIPLADALAAAHEKGVIHRDLKPGNVMVTRKGRVKVLDFGLAKPARADAHAGPAHDVTVAQPVSGAGQVMGTLPYMAPEMVRGETVDARSDVFALGILLYELSTGRRPFAGRTSADVGSAILRDAPAPLARVRPDLPADLERIVGRCLEKDPHRRFRTALDLANELRALRRDVERGGRGTAGKPTVEKVASIAVLPFVNRSASADDEYFSDGLADELLNVLARIKGLRVAARASSFHFKGKDAPLSEIGRILNVATVLDGSVRKAGRRVRISVELVKVADGDHLWSETYDRTLDDIFAVQDDIAHSVVKELRTALLGEEDDSDASGQAKAEVARAAKGRGSDAEAHRLYLLARHLFDRYTRDGTTKAIGYLLEAVARDADFALAWAVLSMAYARQASLDWAPVEEGFRRAREAVQRALALEPDLAEGHMQLGFIRMYHDWDWRGAQASFARALELAPGNAIVLRSSAVLASNLGRIDEAVESFRRALEQDPLSSASYHNLGLALHDRGRDAEAEAALRKALELAPQRASTRAHLATTLLALGRSDEALAEALREPETAFRLWALALVHHGLGQAPESDAALRELVEQFSADAAYNVADVHAARGEVDAAFEWLERAYAQRDSGLSEMKFHRSFRSLHGDARWTDFLRKMGLED